MPYISVIMGVYNCENMVALKDTVDSIINQKFEDWEFIICNDGSTDNTLDNLKKIEKLDNRIKIISYKENRGLGSALNSCINVSKGKYIARQDDYDISKPDRFSKQIKFLEENPDISIVGTIADVFNDKLEWGSYFVPERPSKNDFLWNSPFLHPSIIMKKDDLVCAGGYRISIETRLCEDFDLFMRMYSLGMKGYNIQEKLYKYRIDIGAQKYRPMRVRIEEAKVRYKGYKILGLLPRGIIYVFKPIVIGLIPWIAFKRIRKKQYLNDIEKSNIY